MSAEMLTAPLSVSHSVSSVDVGAWRQLGAHVKQVESVVTLRRGTAELRSFVSWQKRTRRAMYVQRNVTRTKISFHHVVDYTCISAQPSWTHSRQGCVIYSVHIRCSLSEHHYRLRFTEAVKLNRELYFSVISALSTPPSITTARFRKTPWKQ